MQCILNSTLHKVSWIINLAILVPISLFSTAAEKAKIGYILHGSPFHEMKDNKLSGGLEYEVGTLIAHEAGLEPHFARLPESRLGYFLETGRIQMLCLYNPAWIESPKRFVWSAKLTDQEEYYIIRDDMPDITSHEQLKGKHIATQLGYIHSENTMTLFKGGLARRVDTRSTEALYKMLKEGRVDTIIDNTISYNYLRKNKNISSKIHLASLRDMVFPLSCVLSQKNHQKTKRLLTAINTIKNNGKLSKILMKYHAM
ncbi:transporter substrate-binding domain-containing protein [Endozoicomonas sp. SM1973]|uniref:Transporter substrate-binding domain-containing protein n=1 Tax=Spartinivicinus marinus TaxID=2994442 RepID=A0A853IJU5_9GAMM|nr:transporter substrate-binding domain-containing protein [Spartinivicinus marinus]NYZ69355.1 transporter substrate-binding domain-containing protein [Spartinivicinus marinus]